MEISFHSVLCLPCSVIQYLLGGQIALYLCTLLLYQAISLSFHTLREDCLVYFMARKNCLPSCIPLPIHNDEGVSLEHFFSNFFSASLCRFLKSYYWGRFLCVLQNDILFILNSSSTPFCRGCSSTIVHGSRLLKAQSYSIIIPL